MSAGTGRVIIQGLSKAVVAAIVLLVGVGIFALLKATKPEPVQMDREETILPVRLMTVRPVSLARPWIGYGTARPLKAANVSSEIAGVVIERPETTEEGVRVESGTVLVKLDSTEYEARASAVQQSIRALEQELARLDIDEESLLGQLQMTERTIELIEWEREQLVSAQSGGAASRVEIERLRRELALATRIDQEIRGRLHAIPSLRASTLAGIERERANLVVAQLDIDRCQIRAPLMGFLQDVFVDEGDRLNIGSPVARLVDVRRIEIPIRLPVSAAPDTRRGAQVELEARGGAKRAWTAQVDRVSPEADAATRTIVVYAVVDQSSETESAPSLVPGQFVRASVRSLDEAARIVVPRGAVNADQVMVADDDGRARPKSVRVDYYMTAMLPDLDQRETEWAVLESGLVAGDRVIVTNLDELVPGMRINPIEATRAGTTDFSTVRSALDTSGAATPESNQPGGGRQ